MKSERQWPEEKTGRLINTTWWLRGEGRSGGGKAAVYLYKGQKQGRGIGEWSRMGKELRRGSKKLKRSIEGVARRRRPLKAQPRTPSPSSLVGFLKAGTVNTKEAIRLKKKAGEASSELWNSGESLLQSRWPKQIAPAAEEGQRKLPSARASRGPAPTNTQKMREPRKRDER